MTKRVYVVVLGHHVRRVVLFMFIFNLFINNSCQQQQHQQQQPHAATGIQQFIIESPNDQQAKIGDQALFKCKIKNLKGEPQWCIDDFCLGVSKNTDNSNQSNNELVLKGRPRYRIVGDKSKGEFHLLIEPVQLQDNMFFYCMATAASETIKAVKSKKVFLTVLTYPQSLHLENPVHVSLNKPSSIQCVARQSRPPVKILIAINGHLINDESKYKTEIIQIPINDPNSGDSGDAKKRVSYINSMSAISAEQMRHSYYDTITNITIDDITMKMQGQTVECFAYSLVHNGNSNHHHNNIYNINNNRYSSMNTNKPLNLNNVMSIKSVIQVDYAPEVNLRIVSSSNRLLKEEDVISLVCDTRATPAIQSYKWYIGKNYLNGVSDSNLNLKLRKEMHLQTVTCEASNTVASVKASIQLNILFKPSFVRGSKSYILIDKNACNKPLTLDCQVNSNPQSNITWYRRRPSQTYINRYKSKDISSMHQSLKNSIYYSSLFSMPPDDTSDMYEDEVIGTGPTYTIASFNCANLLLNVKNRTSTSRFIIRNKPSRSQSRTKSSQIAGDVSTSTNKNKNNQRFKRNDKDESDNDRSEYDIAQRGESMSSDDYESEYENEDYDNYYYDVDDEANDEDDLNDDRVDFQNIDKQLVDNENDDFGIYLCEATNRLLPSGSSHLLKQSQQQINEYLNTQVVRRYIKLNPVGAPILRLIPTSSINSLSTEETMNLMLKPSVDLSEKYNKNQANQDSNNNGNRNNKNQNEAVPLMELATSIGSSVSLTCLIEPLPQLETIIWIKDNGKIIPNSRYTISDPVLKGRISQTTSITTPLLNSIKLRNFKIKHENLTQVNHKSILDNLNSNANDETIHETILQTTTSSNSITINGVTISDDSVGLMRSTLFIKNIRKQDFGIYKCKSTNAYGSRNAVILIRERNFFDKLNLNGYPSIIVLLGSALVIFIIFILTTICIISKCTRCIRRSSKEKELLSQNLNCESNSDKTINDWLASSKLSNDTAGIGSLMNAVGVTSSTNNTSSTSTTTTSANIKITDSLCKKSSGSSSSSSSTTSSSTSSSQAMLNNSPCQNLLIKNCELIGNCSSLLTEDPEDESSDKQTSNIIILNDSSTSKLINKRAENEMARLNGYHNNATQFSRFLVSSPLISSPKAHNHKDSYEYDDNDRDDDDDDDNDCDDKIKVINSGSCSTTSSCINKSNLQPMMMIRSHNFSNGNFNAKISTATAINGSNMSGTLRGTKIGSNLPKTIVSTPSLNELNEQNQQRYILNGTKPQFSNFTMNRHHFEAAKDYYENNEFTNITNTHSTATTTTSTPNTSNNMNNNETNESEDLNKILQDTTYRLSDIFNELSPGLIVTNSTNTNSAAYSTPINLTTNKLSSASGNTSNNNLKPNSSFNPFPTFSSSLGSSSNNQQQHQNNNNSRQTLLQAINSNSPHSNSNLNKFPNPFNNNTNNNNNNANKFYNSFYRNTSNDNYQNNQNQSYNKINTNNTNTNTINRNKNSSSNNNTLEKRHDDPEDRSKTRSTPTTGLYTQHISKIVSNGSINGKNNYQTIV